MKDLNQKNLRNKFLKLGVKMIGPETVFFSNDTKIGKNVTIEPYVVIGAKVNAALSGKYSPDIEDVQSVATPILRHRIVRNYKAEADGMTVEKIISSLL